MILRNGRLEQLCDAIGLQGLDILNPVNHELIYQQSIQRIQNLGGALTEIPPFEKHPYLEDIDSSTIEGLMIGTFPPISYLCDQLGLTNLRFNGNISPPDLPYFHGNYSSLWRYCPINFDEIRHFPRNDQPRQIKSELNAHGVSYTDIISFCQRELRDNNGVYSYTAEDKRLNNIVLNRSIFPLIFESLNLNRIYFTNASFFGSNNRNNHLFNKYGQYILDERDAFRLFLKGASDYGCNIEIATNENPEVWYNVNEGFRANSEKRTLNNLLTTRVIVKLKLTKEGLSKILQLYSAVSPAAVNRGMVRQNQCVVNFLEVSGFNVEQAPAELLRKVLQSFFENSINGLLEYNYNLQ